MRIIDSSINVYEVYTNTARTIGHDTDYVPRFAIWTYKRFGEIRTFKGDILQGALCVL